MGGEGVQWLIFPPKLRIGDAGGEAGAAGTPGDRPC